MSRPVALASLSFVADEAQTVEQTLDAAVAKIDAVAGAGVDLVALPEAFIHSCPECRNSPHHVFDFAEPIDGPIITRLADRARTHRCYIAAPIILDRCGRHFNTIVLIDRNGDVAAEYDKVYATISEMTIGNDINAGTAPTPFDTDFGRVGFINCFDLNFHDIREQYHRDGVELIVFCSVYHGGLQANVWAYLNHCYFVASIAGDGSRVINPLGRTINEVKVLEGGILVQRIDLDYLFMHTSCNHLQIPALLSRFGKSIELEVCGDDAMMLLTCTDEKIAVTDIQKALDLEAFDAMLDRSRDARQQRIEDGPIQPQRREW